MKFRVYYEDTDAAGIVYHANYIKYCERARSEVFFRSNFSFSKDAHFVVTKIDANFIGSAKLGDLLSIKGEILELKKASLVMLQEIFLGEKKIFDARIKLAYLIDKKPAKMDENTINLLKSFKGF